MSQGQCGGRLLPPKKVAVHLLKRAHVAVARLADLHQPRHPRSNIGNPLGCVRMRGEKLDKPAATSRCCVLPRVHALPEPHGRPHVEAQPCHQLAPDPVGLQLHFTRRGHLEQSCNQEIVEPQNAGGHVQKRREHDVDRLLAQLFQQVVGQLVRKLVRQDRGQAVVVAADRQDRQEHKDLAVGENEGVGRVVGGVDHVNVPLQQLQVLCLLRVRGVVHRRRQQPVHHVADPSVGGVGFGHQLAAVLAQDLGVGVVANFALEPVGDPEEPEAVGEGCLVEVVEVERDTGAAKVEHVPVAEKQEREWRAGVFEPAVGGVVAAWEADRRGAEWFSEHGVVWE